jgi:hypothetical protein
MAAVIRKAISKRVRFEVFKRDSFTCQYCGCKAPEVILWIDHIVPVAKGGKNDILNLVTACEPCNAGKSAKLLSDTSAIAAQHRQLEELQRRREQLDLLVQWRSGLSTIADDCVSIMLDHWKKSVPTWTLSEAGLAKWKILLRKYPLQEMLEVIDAAVESYLCVDGDGRVTEESAAKMLEYIPRIARMRKDHADNPHFKDLFYVRAIVRNRMFCNEQYALSLLKEAWKAGVSIENLKEIAKSTTNWTEWQREMYVATEETSK